MFLEYKTDNRVVFGIDISLSAITIRGNALNGSLEMLAAIAYDGDAKALFLMDPHVQQCSLNGMPEQNAKMLQELFLPVIEKLLKRKAVYRFEEQDTLTAIAGTLVQDVRVRNNCLELVWGI